MPGIQYRVTNTREDVRLYRIQSDLNFDRIEDPVVPGLFWNFNERIGNGEVHVIKVRTAAGVVYFESTVASVSRNDLIMAAPITLNPPDYGIGDTFSVYKKELDDSLTHIATGLSQKYVTVYDNTYRMRFEIVSTVDVPMHLFVLKKHSRRNKDGTYTVTGPTPQRVANVTEVYGMPSVDGFVFDTNKSGFQYYRDRTFETTFATQEEASNANSSIVGQLAQLLNGLFAEIPYTPSFTIIQQSGTVQTGQPIAFDAIGERGGVAWSFVQNQSGAYMTTNGQYIAGANPGIDIIQALDASGTSVTTQITVVNTFGSVIEGEYLWQVG